MINMTVCSNCQRTNFDPLQLFLKHNCLEQNNLTKHICVDLHFRLVAVVGGVVVGVRVGGMK